MSSIAHNGRDYPVRPNFTHPVVRPFSDKEIARIIRGQGNPGSKIKVGIRSRSSVSRKTAASIAGYRRDEIVWQVAVEPPLVSKWHCPRNRHAESSCISTNNDLICRLSGNDRWINHRQGGVGSRNARVGIADNRSIISDVRILNIGEGQRAVGSP